MTRDEILQSAITAVCADRNEDYGEPEQNFGAIAEFWTDYLTRLFDHVTPISRQDVANMMILFKLGRLTSGKGTVDSYVDIAGYAACGGEML